MIFFIIYDIFFKIKNYRLAVASASEQNHIIMTFGAVA